jgi:hypothetical protein
MVGNVPSCAHAGIEHARSEGVTLIQQRPSSRANAGTSLAAFRHAGVHRSLLNNQMAEKNTVFVATEFPAGGMQSSSR